MCLPGLRSTVTSSEVIPKFRANRDRRACLPPPITTAAVRADLHLRGETHLHCPTCSQAHSQGAVRHFALSRILLDKYFTYRPTERLLNSWRLLGLDLAPGTITDGLRRLEVLLRPIYEASSSPPRNPQGDLHQGDETRWQVFVPMEGKEGFGWWLWLVKSLDTVIYLLDPSRGHTVVENHFGAQSRGVLVVDRYAAYQAMIWVKDG